MISTGEKDRCMEKEYRCSSAPLSDTVDLAGRIEKICVVDTELTCLEKVCLVCA